MPARTKVSTKRVAPPLRPSILVPPESPLTRPARPPTRTHSPFYHYPLLLQDRTAADALLTWFDGIEGARSMPWRKPWIDPAAYAGKEKELGDVLAKRAYEVWVSEVMLQQTRVSTVIPYFTTWISQWPTIHALARASPSDVLAAWKGLGYYSRATRLHEGAKQVVAQAQKSDESHACAMPSTADALQTLPGVGRYTAGAVSSIAFGEAEPVLDGNVARVLSRQLGYFVDVKEKKSTDVLWEVADALVKFVARWPEQGRSDVPGRWNQAVMELGSTVCTPRPKCGECPVQTTCRAYAEGKVLAEGTKKKKSCEPVVEDIEDACTACEVLNVEEVAVAPEDEEDAKEEPLEQQPAKRRKIEAKPANTISQYFTIRASKRSHQEEKTGGEEGVSTAPSTPLPNAPTPLSHAPAPLQPTPSTPHNHTKAISQYCSLFPKRPPKKKVAEEACIVCMIQRRATRATASASRSEWLIEQRPATGLLASLWQFPQKTLPAAQATDDSEGRRAVAEAFVAKLLRDGSSERGGRAGDFEAESAVHGEEVRSLVHVFTHLKLTMHVHLFRLPGGEGGGVAGLDGTGQARKWVRAEDMDGETLSTGMRRCWDLVKKGT